MPGKATTTHLAAIAAFALLAAAVLGPLRSKNEVWGGATDDVFTHLHLVFWQAREAAQGNPVPFHDGLLRYPDGGNIWLSDPAGGLLAAPAARLAGPMLGYGFLIFIDLLFACWAMFWFVNRRTKDPGAAFVAGVIYGLNPFMLAQVNNGLVESLAAGWIPIFMGALLDLFDDAEHPSGPKTARLVLLTAAAWWMTAVSGHWFHALFAGVLFFMALVYRLTGPGRARILARGAAAAGAFLALILPIAILFIRRTQSGDMLTRSFSLGTDISQSRPVFTAKPDLEGYLRIIYIGAAAPLLALSGLWGRGRREKLEIAGWMFAALFFAAWVIGNDLAFCGCDFVAQAGKWLVLAISGLEHAIPIVSRIAHQYRVFVMVHFCLAVAAGIGIAGRFPGFRARGLIYGIIALAVLAETVVFSGAPVPMPRQDIRAPAPVASLAGGPEDFAVFDLPVRIHKPILHRFVMNQLFHARPIPYSDFPTTQIAFSPSLARASLLANLLAAASDPEGAQERDRYFKQMEPDRNAKRLLECLSKDETCDEDLTRELGDDLARYEAMRLTRFVLHSDILAEGSPLPRICTMLFGPPALEGEGVSIYILNSSSPASRSTR